MSTEAELRLAAWRQRCQARRFPDALGKTVTLLRMPDSATKVFVVGTAHFSRESQQEVAQLIDELQPDAVFVELCSGRRQILTINEETLLEEAKSMTMQKLVTLVKEYGALSGLVHYLFLYMNAEITRQLGMAAGGEFRTAFQHAQLVPCCEFFLGDRPIAITMKRALSELGFWERLKLYAHFLTMDFSITPEMVEKLKSADFLEECMRELVEQFPKLSKVIVAERDQYLAKSLRIISSKAQLTIDSMASVFENPDEDEDELSKAAIVIAVVGYGHVSGMIHYWEKTDEIDMQAISSMPVPQPSLLSRCFSIKGLLLAIAAFAGINFYMRRR